MTNAVPPRFPETPSPTSGTKVHLVNPVGFGRDRGNGTSARWVSRTALTAAVLGPLVAQIAIGVLARPPDFFRPSYFLATFLVALVVLGPGSLFIGMASAEAAARTRARRLSPAATCLGLAVAGALAGWVHYLVLARILGSSPAVLIEEEALSLPSLRAGLSLSGALLALRSVRLAYTLKPPSISAGAAE